MINTEEFGLREKRSREVKIAGIVELGKQKSPKRVIEGGPLKTGQKGRCGRMGSTWGRGIKGLDGRRKTRRE